MQWSLSKNRTGDASQYSQQDKETDRKQQNFGFLSSKTKLISTTGEQPGTQQCLGMSGADVRKMGIVSEKESIKTTKTDTGSIKLKGNKTGNQLKQEQEEKHRCGQYTENSTCYSG